MWQPACRSVCSKRGQRIAPLFFITRDDFFGIFSVLTVIIINIMAPVLDLSVIRSCRILFGNELAVTLAFLRSLDAGSIKSAFRRRALETHPDRFVIAGPVALREQTIQFVEVTSAYDRLNTFLAERERTLMDPLVRAEMAEALLRKPEPAVPPAQPSRFFNGEMPKRSLLFGEYLYYTRSIPQHVLTEAIIWQRGLRPRFGDVALRWRLLSADTLDEIIRSKRFGEPLGESAIRIMKLNRFQVNTILLFQRKKQSPIGEYFTSQGHIMQFMLRRLLNEQKNHNDQFRSLSAFRKAD